MKIKCPRFNSKLEEESISESVSFPYFFNTIKLVFLGSILSGCGTSNQFGFLQSEPDTYYKHPLNDTVTPPTEYGNKKFGIDGILTRRISPLAEVQDFKIIRKNIYHSDGLISTISGTIHHPDGSTSRISGNTIYHSDGSISRINGNTTYHPDGSSSRRSGNNIYHSDGSNSRISGNNTYHSDGSSSRVSGNNIYHSDGSTSRISGIRHFDQDGNEIFE